VAERRAVLIRVSKSEVLAGNERLANSLAIKVRPLKILVRSLVDDIVSI
ncbi:hypothetical protein A2U01_0115635, partial [Trifolium medium]|nr:hypothetical protein [Trifolium medium]